MLPKVKGPEMNDRDRVNDVLATEKYLITVANIAAWESSHSELHQDAVSICQELQECHRDLFNLMFKKGWYKLEAEEQQKLDQAYKQFSNYSTQFPYTTQAH
ncbi:spore coat protein [Caldalkalibacillus salinus]|uniref:spore coat protein n=1 Tax=Caldalkalibacillus salinus TaxID=2803787 RepID=UPI001F1ADE87|nr:spore coat protein [Caldalkalibacillus salinus]